MLNRILAMMAIGWLLGSLGACGTGPAGDAAGKTAKAAAKQATMTDYRKCLVAHAMGRVSRDEPPVAIARAARAACDEARHDWTVAVRDAAPTPEAAAMMIDELEAMSMDTLVTAIQDFRADRRL